MVLPETDGGGAMVVAERMRLAVSTSDVSIGEGVAIPVRVSIGVARLTAAISTTDGLRAAADDALYEAKRTGRDRSVLAA